MEDRSIADTSKFGLKNVFLAFPVILYVPKNLMNEDFTQKYLKSSKTVKSNLRGFAFTHRPASNDISRLSFTSISQ